jgi:hypothetical protein
VRAQGTASRSLHRPAVDEGRVEIEAIWTGKNGSGLCAKREVDLRSGEPAAARHTAAGVVAWRSARLRKAGFDSELAEQLSRECGVDLHALIELVERGCPPPLAARILAPLDHERRDC